MSERKVLNKYYPPDFDPNNIPRCKVQRNKTFGVRLMAPCNMKCNTCGEYIAKAKKFNARKEDVDDENYLGLRIYRFYIKCPMCMAEIVFKTDPEHTDYIIEAGATRNFQAQILAQRQAQAEADKAEEEEKSNPMKMLENRTKQSRHEMDMIEKLEELKDLNQRQAHVNYDSMLKQYSIVQQRLEQQQEVEDEQYVKSVFGSADGCVKRLRDSDSDSDGGSSSAASNTRTPGQLSNSAQPTDILTQPAQSVSSAVEKKPWERSLGSLGGGKKSGSSLLGIVRPTNNTTKSSANATKSSASATKSAATVPGAFKRPNLGITMPNKNAGGLAVENGGSSSRSAGGTSAEERLGVSVTDGDVKVNGKCLTDGDVEGGSVSIAAESNSSREVAVVTEPTKSVSAPTGLGLLGAYSDTDSDE